MDEKQAIYNELKELSKIANQRLDRISANFGSNSWSAKRLINKLGSSKINGLTEAGRISVKKNKSTVELRAELKAVQNFLNSKTSTVKGIRETIKNTKSSIIQTLQKDNIENNVVITDKDAEKFYDLLGTYNQRNLIKEVGASELWAFLQEHKEKNSTKDDFLTSFFDYFTNHNAEDLTERAKAEDLYDKYVKKK